jgi:hypothetical protein
MSDRVSAGKPQSAPVGRRTKRLLFALVAVVLVVQAGLWAYRSFDGRAVSHEIAQAREAAQSTASATTTPDDAHQWLEDNGYHVVIWVPYRKRGFIGSEESSSDGKHLIVLGQRQIRRGGWPLQPTWINLTFRFTIHQKFEDVKADSSLRKTQ